MMKKTVIFIVLLIICALATQFSVWWFFQKNSKSVLLNLQSDEYINVLDKNFSSGFFKFDSFIDIELKNNNLKEIFNANEFIKIRLNLSGKQDLFSAFSTGYITVLNSPYIDFVRSIFGDEKFINLNTYFKFNGDSVVDTYILPAKFKYNDLSIDISSAKLSAIISKDMIKDVNATLDYAKFSIDDMQANITNLSYAIKPKIPINIMNIDKTALTDANTTTKISKIDIVSNFVNLYFDDISSFWQVSSQDDTAWFVNDLNIKNIDILGVKFKNFNFLSNAQNIDKISYQNIIYGLKKSSYYDINNEILHIMRKNPRFNIEKFSFENTNGDKFTLDCSFWIDSSSNIANFDEIEECIKFAGNLELTNSLSSFLPLFPFLAMYEDKLVETGILIKTPNSYKAKFKISDDNKDIIFNDVNILSNFL
ncbi:Bacterial protein of uncharacterised function (DUF945) [Campylobacter hyointestinalis]|uniref:Bacterial protein of uncharacterized function (DUF945) n=2 Tax=Campylobacter hyointestinalis TaxID=198 RepID=A0A0S4SVW4_CAMHY|nr:Bacterial protein of uncharacterised function (DUF945) [Campylobacter hyointestinalis subsp. hyointestinalis]CUU88799.1 Bacterial protein of uncharacterised function (DUF945) [Campylobacter hyointestinalis subsp. hyointestinalis]CUU90406.1 Bacterial protein of uncharacterised function (DUF945) [Campylobacter hyointestinalis subsp. hyointestinalis]CUU92351.1 Bacterial protein of uncharacterised function (DUF945) [Campylobacter hyointestinalis subsp. hyointestinalis]CUU92393.1 Bacterial protei